MAQPWISGAGVKVGMQQANVQVLEPLSPSGSLAWVLKSPSPSESCRWSFGILLLNAVQVLVDTGEMKISLFLFSVCVCLSFHLSIKEISIETSLKEKENGY